MSLPHDRTYAMYLADIDGRYGSSNGGGSDALALTRAVAGALAANERLVAFCSATTRDELGALPSPGRVDAVPVARSQGFRHQLHHDQLGVARLVARAGVDVIHFANGRAPWRSLAPVKVVATIEDDVPVQYRASRFEARRSDVRHAYVVANLRRTLETADAILTMSEASRRQLGEIVPRRAAAIRVVRAGLVVGDRRDPGPDARAPRFVVFDSPSADDHADEAAGFALRYVMERRLADHKVLLLGSGRGGGVRDRCPDRFETEPEATSSERIGELVRSSRAVVVAARDEGFRLPAVNAWAHGTPAVVADCDAASELLHGVPGVYRAGDYASFAAALDRALAIDETGCHAWSKLVTLRCGWGRTATEVLSVYRALAAATAQSAPQQELVS